MIEKISPLGYNFDAQSQKYQQSSLDQAGQSIKNAISWE